MSFARLSIKVALWIHSMDWVKFYDVVMSPIKINMNTSQSI